MRPLKSGLLSYLHHVFVRNGIYYYRTDIPLDIQKHFPNTELKQSLKTKDSKIAKVMAISLEHRLQQTFCMIRSGMLTDAIIAGMVAEIYPRRKVEKPRGIRLSVVVEDYMKMYESGWTYKTKLEVRPHPPSKNFRGPACLTPYACQLSSPCPKTLFHCLVSCASWFLAVSC